MLSPLSTRCVIRPGLFQRYITAISSIPLLHIAMASRKCPQPVGGDEAPSNPLAPLELEACSYVEVISPPFDPNRVLRRVFFTNHEKSKCASVGFYPDHNYQPLLRIKLVPIVLTGAWVATIAQHLPNLIAAMCRIEQY